MSSIHQQSGKELGTDITLTIVTDTQPKADAIFVKLWSQIRQFDMVCSRFRVDSELTRVNNHAGKPTPISFELEDHLTAAYDCAKATDGLFNPFILPALQRAGYLASWQPTSATRTPPDYREREVVPFDMLHIKNGSVQIPLNTAIDLGGSGKGYLLDQLSNYLDGRHIDSYWISLGGDIIARGNQPDRTPWQLAIANATNEESSVATVMVMPNEKIAIATSGVTKRAGKTKNGTWHHIIDPATGLSAQTDIMTASVCASRGIDADIYASCLVALGTKDYQNFANTHKITDMLVQTSSDTVLSGSRIQLT